MVRTPSYDENGKKKGTWTPEEDRKLAAYVTKYGCWNWRQLPKYAGENYIYIYWFILMFNLRIYFLSHYLITVSCT